MCCLELDELDSIYDRSRVMEAWPKQLKGIFCTQIVQSIFVTFEACIANIPPCNTFLLVWFVAINVDTIREKYWVEDSAAKAET